MEFVYPYPDEEKFIIASEVTATKETEIEGTVAHVALLTVTALDKKLPVFKVTPGGP
jgi:hypothetical protein